MSSIFNVGKDLVSKIQLNCEPELLKEIFALRTEKWKYYQISMEGGTIGLFGDLFHLEYCSFELIPMAVEIVLEQEDSDLFITALSLLYKCIEESDTTEIPAELTRQWKVLEKRVREIENRDSLLCWNAICKWYRIK